MSDQDHGRGTRAPGHTHDTNLLAVLALLGHTVTDNKNVDRCPVCEAQGGCRVYGHRVLCFHADCEIKATATDLIAHRLDLVTFGADGWAEPLTREGFAAVEAFRAEHDLEVLPVIAAPKEDPAGLRAPFSAEVATVWSEASPVDTDRPTTNFFKHRGIDVDAVVSQDLARTVPSMIKEVGWGSYWPKGHRLLLPVYDAQGDLVAVRGRWVHPRDPKPAKSVSPTGWPPGALKSTCYANDLGVELLKGEISDPVNVVIVEGGMDFLTWSTVRPDVAVFGVWSGSWSKDIADRIPDGSAVVIRTHHDAKGNEYGMKVALTLAGRVRLLRSRPGPAGAKSDENDRHIAGTLPHSPLADACPFDAEATLRRWPLPPLRRDSDGRVLPDRENAVTMLERFGPWAGNIWMDVFDGQRHLCAEVIGQGLHNRIMFLMSRATRASFKEHPLTQALIFVTHHKKRHPVAEWLRSLGWDGVERLHRLLPDYLGTMDDRLHQQLGSMWATGAVSRPLNPGSKLDYTLVLVGKQDIGKSTAVESLAMRPEWFNDTPADLRSKDARIALRGTWLMEMAELDSIKRSELSAMKAFLTDTVDKYRPPYGKTDELYPRSTVFVGTTNERQFLTDRTGNRRFWPVETEHIDIEALKRDREQLWAEAVHRYDAGKRWWPSAKLARRLNRHRVRFQVGRDWEAQVRDWLEHAPEEFSLQELLTETHGVAPTDKGWRGHQMMAAALLRELGYVRGPKRRRGDKRVSTWVKD